MKNMKKLPESQLKELLSIALSDKTANAKQCLNKIDNIAYNRGFKINRKEVGEMLASAK